MSKTAFPAHSATVTTSFVTSEIDAMLGGMPAARRRSRTAYGRAGRLGYAMHLRARHIISDRLRRLGGLWNASQRFPSRRDRMTMKQWAAEYPLRSIAQVNMPGSNVRILTREVGVNLQVLLRIIDGQSRLEHWVSTTKVATKRSGKHSSDSAMHLYWP